MNYGPIEVNDLFFEQTSEFTIFVVENRFFTGTGRKFFEEHKEKSKGYLDNEYKVNKFLTKDVYAHIFKSVKNPKAILKYLFDSSSSIPISEAISLLSKTFGVLQQHAAGPELIDPIIIFEGVTTRQTIGSIMELYKNSHLKPKIIVVSKDNNYERIKSVLCYCPHETKIIYLKNDTSKIESRVFNSGANDVNSFISLYGRQCFNSCSRTPTDILYNPDWAEDSTIKEFSPEILYVRTKLMAGEKLEAAETINHSIENIWAKLEFINRSKERNLLLGFDCFAKLFRVFCRDKGGQDIIDVQRASAHLENELLNAHLYRYSDFIQGLDSTKIIDNLNNAERIFREYEMEDHALYCKNNRLLKSFYTSQVSHEQFKQMTIEARLNVPGLVGMPILLNNSGVAYLYNSMFEQAVECFEMALQYNPQNDHKLGISCNLLVAKYLYGEEVVESDVTKLFFEAEFNFDLKKQAFLLANNLTNLAYILSKDKNVSADLFQEKFYNDVIHIALQGPFGVNSLSHQLHRINRHEKINIACGITPKVDESKRCKFVEICAMNPAIYNAWL